MASYQELKILQTPIPKTAEFLERLHVDIKKFLPVIFLGFQYFLSIKNDAWGMFFVLSMKTKEEIYDKLVDFWIWIENLLDWKIKYIHSKEELKSNIFDILFKAIGIYWEPLVPYILQQNGKIKRGMYTLMSIVRLVLKEFWLSKRLLDEIVQAVAYVKNHTISQSTNGITLYKRVHKFVPSITHLYALGYWCYIYISNTTMGQIMYDRR